MNLRIALACWGYPRGDSIFDRMEARARGAADAGARLLVFPECLMYVAPPSAHGASMYAEPLDGPFVTAARTLASTHGITLVVPIFECDPRGGLPYNTCVVIGPEGEIDCAYRKAHLYDAHGVSESDATQRGDALCPTFEVAGARLGLGICYDLRFPEVARAAALAGAELVVFPAAWRMGPGKRDHWETLIRARAIENELFCAGVCHRGADCVGVSLMAGPTGETVTLKPYASATGELLLWHADADLTLVGDARGRMDVLHHRRPELYDTLVDCARRP